MLEWIHLLPTARWGTMYRVLRIIDILNLPRLVQKQKHISLGGLSSHQPDKIEDRRRLALGRKHGRILAVVTAFQPLRDPTFPSSMRHLCTFPTLLITGMTLLGSSNATVAADGTDGRTKTVGSCQPQQAPHPTRPRGTSCVLSY